jgi:hypothetical protein
MPLRRGLPAPASAARPGLAHGSVVDLERIELVFVRRPYLLTPTMTSSALSDPRLTAAAASSIIALGMPVPT